MGSKPTDPLATHQMARLTISEARRVAPHLVSSRVPYLILAVGWLRYNKFCRFSEAASLRKGQNVQMYCAGGRHPAYSLRPDWSSTS
jgi:hypothetical protein